MAGEWLLKIRRRQLNARCRPPARRAVFAAASAYSGSVSVPLTVKLPATAGAPVSGWPPPTETV